MKELRGNCYGPLKKGCGGEKDEEGNIYVPSYVGLHTSVSGPLASHKFYSCPVAVGRMEDNAELDYVAEAYNLWKKFSESRIPDSPKLLQALSIFDEEVDALRVVMANRKD